MKPYRIIDIKYFNIIYFSLIHSIISYKEAGWHWQFLPTEIARHTRILCHERSNYRTRYSWDGHILQSNSDKRA